VVALFGAPNVIGVERQRDKDPAAGFGNNGLEMLCRQDDSFNDRLGLQPAFLQTIPAILPISSLS
jgi:hypothetical protein